MTLRPSRLALATFTPAERRLARAANGGRIIPAGRDVPAYAGSREEKALSLAAFAAVALFVAAAIGTAAGLALSTFA